MFNILSWQLARVALTELFDIVRAFQELERDAGLVEKNGHSQTTNTSTGNDDSGFASIVPWTPGAVMNIHFYALKFEVEWRERGLGWRVMRMKMESERIEIV